MDDCEAMSHNITKVNAESPSAAGVVSQSLEDLSDVGTLTVSDGQALGWSAGPTVDAVTLPLGYDIAGSLFVISGGWSGSYTYVVGDGLYWRHPSATVNADAAKITFQGGTWINQWTLAAGSYLIKMDIPLQPSAASAYAIVRLKDVTNTQYLGPKIKIGDGRSSNHLMFIVTPSASTTYMWEILSINGSVALPNQTTLKSMQGLFLEVL